jgi:hypothetical protein
MGFTLSLETQKQGIFHREGDSCPPGTNKSRGLRQVREVAGSGNLSAGFDSQKARARLPEPSAFDLVQGKEIPFPVKSAG